MPLICKSVSIDGIVPKCPSRLSVTVGPCASVKERYKGRSVIVSDSGITCYVHTTGGGVVARLSISTIFGRPFDTSWVSHLGPTVPVLCVAQGITDQAVSFML